MWDRKITVGLTGVTLSDTQQEFVDYCVDQAGLTDANAVLDAQREVSLSGDPGSGKTEAPPDESVGSHRDT